MKTMKFLSMAALAMVGAVISSCSSSSDFDETPAQPASTGNTETLTVTVGMDGGDTRALAADGTKTFAVGDKIAVVYQNTSDETVKAESEALTAGDITDGSQSATFTVTLTDADKTKDVTYIYPAAMAKDDGTVNYEALNSQDGTLATLASDLDLATYTAAWDDASLPAGELANQLAILAITLKSSGDINNTIKGMTISDGTYCYSVDRTPSDGAIYMAIRPTSGATISVSATNNDVSQTYIKNLTGKTYEKNNGYVLNWTMTASSYRMASAATSEDKGKEICAAGHIHTAGGDSECTETRVAKIVYVGNETGESPFGFIHGLALALSDVYYDKKWKTERTDAGHTKQNDCDNFTSESGLQYNATHNSDTYPAFKAAIANDGTAAPTGCSSWFLASGYQWQKMIDAAGLSNLGLQGDAHYWSSSEVDASFAWNIRSNYGLWYSGTKTYDCLVRACLAF